jgi:hypothetical protein
MTNGDWRMAMLERRPDAQLRWAFDEPPIVGALYLDASVYLDVMEGCTPEAVDKLLTYRIYHHSSVRPGELTHVFGGLDLAHASTKAVLRAVSATIEDIPGHRLHAPDNQTWGRAGILAGELIPRSALPRGEGHERRFLNDALIYQRAGLVGANVLTGNVRDFNCLGQLMQSIGVVCYRCDQS